MHLQNVIACRPQKKPEKIITLSGEAHKCLPLSRHRCEFELRTVPFAWAFIYDAKNGFPEAVSCSGSRSDDAILGAIETYRPTATVLHYTWALEQVGY